MKENPSKVADRLMNLYRLAHVVDGGWSAVNGELLAESDAAVLEEIKKLATGEKLAAHIKSLRDGKTDRDSILPELMPYGGLMATHPADSTATAVVARLSNEDFDSLERELENFEPNQESLQRIESLPFVQQFGDRWLAGVRAALGDRPDLVARWKIVYSASRAFDLWNRASDILSWSPTERTRAEVQADLPEYETYLPMFGEAGGELLSKLRAFVASI
ncbi:MAG: hypothetical protein FWE64_03830 [Alphaproteobacteria bacterium]|nr:hypothetical protein [Alphaproteobacteria bacterium]